MQRLIVFHRHRKIYFLQKMLIKKNIAIHIFLDQQMFGYTRFCRIKYFISNIKRRVQEITRVKQSHFNQLDIPSLLFFRLNNLYLASNYDLIPDLFLFPSPFAAKVVLPFHFVDGNSVLPLKVILFEAGKGELSFALRTNFIVFPDPLFNGFLFEVGLAALSEGRSVWDLFSEGACVLLPLHLKQLKVGIFQPFFSKQFCSAIGSHSMLPRKNLSLANLKPRLTDYLIRAIKYSIFTFIESLYLKLASNPFKMQIKVFYSFSN